MSADLSPRGRASNLDRMASERFDLLVIGGGIVGAGIARDAAMRGLRTALVERGDFASGTSSKTSRLIHGGLRYLKNFKVGLVRQSVRERDLLLERSPSLVRPLAFTIPAYEGRGMGRGTLRFGLWVYDFLSRDKVLPRRRWLSTQELREREPDISGQGLRGGGVYHDAMANDARVVLAVIRAAADAGAAVANHAMADRLLLEGGRVIGANVHDRMTGKDLDVHATLVINATGVWLDRLRSAASSSRTLRPTKGIHVFLPREKLGNRGAVVLHAKRDGRMLFVLPWGTLTLVGTTDTDFSGDPDHVIPEVSDVEYLLEAVNDAFPEARVRPEDVVSAYAGLRPLIQEDAPMKESEISREHEIFEDPDGLLSVAGGKLTTHRAMAAEVVDRACRRLGRRVPCSTADAPLGPRPDAAASLGPLGIPEAETEFLGSRHAVEDVRAWMEEPGALTRILPEHPYLWLEVTLAVECEMAMALEDVMVRRLGLFYEAQEQGLGIAPAIAARMAAHLGWEASRIAAELGAYQALVADHRRFREGHGR